MDEGLPNLGGIEENGAGRELLCMYSLHTRFSTWSKQQIK